MLKKYLFFLSVFLFSITAVSAQTKIKGTVFDENGETIIGATITAKGNVQIGVSTDINGKFELSIPAEYNKIVVSYIGMKAQELPIKPDMKIVLVPDTKQLEEVVVTGMSSTDRRLFTGATTKIDASKAKIDGIPDISRSLEGRVPGVSVQNVSGTFGTAPKIRVRGATSIYGNSKPLWVVDGIVIEDAVDISSDDLSSGNAETLISSAVAGLNADDIESIQVLKDGSATSIYGARAMGGVIVITTKKGKNGVSRLNYTSELTMNLKPSYRNFNISNSQEQMGIYRELEQKGWLEFATIASASSSGIYGKMYDLIDTYLGKDTNGNPIYGLENSDPAKNKYLRQAEFRNTDWFDLLFKNSVMQNHSVSFSTGNEVSTFYMSISAMNDPGWTKSSNVQRYTFNANGTYKIFKSLELRVQSNGSHRGQKAPGTLNKETDVVSGEVKRGFDINPYSYALNTSRTLDPSTYYKRNYAPFNIFHELDNNYIDLTVDDLKFQGELTWRIRPSWSVNALTAVRYQTTSQEHYIKDESNMSMAYRAGTQYGEGGENETIVDVNPYLYRDPKDPLSVKESVLPKGGIYDRTNYGLKSTDFRVSTNYSNEFENGMHTINFWGGMELNSTERSKGWGRMWGVQYENGMSSFFDPSVFKQSKEENSPYYSFSPSTKRNVAFFGTGTYAYKHKYVLNLTGRYEGTNKLGKSRSARWLPTWNVAGAWNMHEESWFKNPVLSHSMLKVSYSLTADAGPTDVSNSLPIYVPNTPWRPSSDVIEGGLKLSDTENKDLTYEKKHEFNFGIDMGFLNDRINLVADYYKRNNFDLIGQIYTTGIGGGSIQKWANVASMSSGGTEFSISSLNIVKKYFKWNTDLVFTYQTTKITDLKSKSRVIDLITGDGFPLQGYPVRALFSIPFVGLNDEGLPTFKNEKGEVTISDIHFQENKNLDFLKYEGPTDPPYTGSLGNEFTYKNFRLNILLTYSFGNVIRMDNAFFITYSDMIANPKEFKNRWVLPGDEKTTNIPVIASRRQVQTVDNLAYAYNAYNYSTERIAKGDFVRLKEVSLSYNIPSKLLSTINIKSLSLKFQATNLTLLYADKKLNGQDPEFMNSGGVASPMPKQFNLTLRLGL
ncbi:MAG: SusC/RagA family TonB-linked outer membrane protein [Paludibacter sp.]|nr:SusC/RagA family TonB-linked outer membrane protein [Paludibacter sp.]